MIGNIGVSNFNFIPIESVCLADPKTYLDETLENVKNLCPSLDGGNSISGFFDFADQGTINAYGYQTKESMDQNSVA